MKSYFLILGFLSVFFISCKKNNEDPGLATAARIQGNWQIDSITINQNFNGTINKQTFVGTNVDMVNFGSDGKMETKFIGNNSVTTYKVKNDTIVTIGGDSGYIQELTDKKLILYTKAEAGSLGYMETIYYLKR